MASQAAKPDEFVIEQPMEQCLSASSSDISCLTTSDVKSGLSSPRSNALDAVEGGLDDGSGESVEAGRQGKAGDPTAREDGDIYDLLLLPPELPDFFDESRVNPAPLGKSVQPCDGGMGEVFLPDGTSVKRDVEAVTVAPDAPLDTAEEWESLLECKPEDILKFSYDDIAGPINQISLPEPVAIASVFSDDPGLPESDLGEVMDWESLSLPDIYDFCANTAASAQRGRSLPKRKYPSPPEESIKVFLGPVPMRSRSKRPRGEKQPWSPQLLVGLLERPKAHRSFRLESGPRNPCPGGMPSPGADCCEAIADEFLGAGDESGFASKRGNPFTETGAIRRCSHCSTTKTPQWRAGPHGPKTLCNACGVRFKSGRLCAEYRPASSPEFEADKHSNSHRKIVEMRKLREQGLGDEELQQLALMKPPAGQRKFKRPGVLPKKFTAKKLSAGDAKAGPLEKTSSSEAASQAKPATAASVLVGQAATPTGSLPVVDQPVSRISVRVVADKKSVDGARIPGNEGNSLVFELGKQSLSKALGEDVLSSPCNKASADVMLKPASPCTPESKSEQPGSAERVGVVPKSPVELTAQAKPVSSQAEERPLDHQKKVKQEVRSQAGNVQGLQVEVSASPVQSQQHARGTTQPKQWKEQHKVARQRSGQGFHLQQAPPQPFGAEQKLVYYPHSSMLFPPALPQVPFMHPPHMHQQPFHFQHQLLLQQQHQRAPEALQDKALHHQQQVGNPQQEQCVVDSVTGSPGSRGSVSSPSPFGAPLSAPSSPQTPEGSRASVPPAQDAVPKAQSGTAQALAKPHDQERLREQLRRRQEIGQSIRRQQDSCCSSPLLPAWAAAGGCPASPLPPKSEKDAEAAAESLPISMAYAQISPVRMPKVSRQAPGQSGPSSSAARTSIRHAPQLLQKPAQHGSLPAQAELSDDKVERPWEDVSPEHIYVPGSVGVEA